jgi:hypothetical protein
MALQSCILCSGDASRPSISSVDMSNRSFGSSIPRSSSCALRVPATAVSLQAAMGGASMRVHVRKAVDPPFFQPDLRTGSSGSERETVDFDSITARPRVKYGPASRRP